jgi:H+/Cl- antiporter ClcA
MTSTIPPDPTTEQPDPAKRIRLVRLGGFIHVDWAEQRDILYYSLRWLLLGSLVGICAGVASAIFLITLAWATQTRVAHPWLLFLLPLAGLFIGWVYQRYGSSAARGNNLVIEEVNRNSASIPLIMAPLVLAGTVGTHLFGGSAGREGTAIQMGASLADALRHRLKLTGEDRRMMLLAGISGGFGSVFGTPLAGFVFALEVQRVGRIRYDSVIPCLTAAVVGDLVTRALGAPHSHYPALANLTIDGLLALKVAVAGIGFGLASLLFIELTHSIKALVLRWSPRAVLRPFFGGILVILLALIFGSDYLGLSLPLITQSLDGSGVLPLAFLLKLLFTAVTLGTGFLGGEVTPLFVIGSTLGYTLGLLLGVDASWLAALGFVAVFAGASNTPLASMLMGVELFGGGSVIYLALACFIAYLASGHRSIYVTQIVDTSKVYGLIFTPDESLEMFATSRRKGKSTSNTDEGKGATG